MVKKINHFSELGEKFGTSFDFRDVIKKTKKKLSFVQLIKLDKLFKNIVPDSFIAQNNHKINSTDLRYLKFLKIYLATNPIAANRKKIQNINIQKLFPENNEKIKIPRLNVKIIGETHITIKKNLSLGFGFKESLNFLTNITNIIKTNINNFTYLVIILFITYIILSFIFKYLNKTNKIKIISISNTRSNTKQIQISNTKEIKQIY
jgi:hypothetical protein